MPFVHKQSSYVQFSLVCPVLKFWCCGIFSPPWMIVPIAAVSSFSVVKLVLVVISDKIDGNLQFKVIEIWGLVVIFSLDFSFCFHYQGSLVVSIVKFDSGVVLEFFFEFVSTKYEGFASSNCNVLQYYLTCLYCKIGALDIFCTQSLCLVRQFIFWSNHPVNGAYHYLLICMIATPFMRMNEILLIKY